jgi:hypothetical protein
LSKAATGPDNTSQNQVTNLQLRKLTLACTPQRPRGSILPELLTDLIKNSPVHSQHTLTQLLNILEGGRALSILQGEL